MSPAAYLDLVKERLLTDPIVAEFQVRRERTSVTDAHLCARVVLANGTLLEFSEYAVHTNTGEMEVVVYSYHWSTAAGDLICRWDNTPHFPDLPGFPHHMHDGRTGTTQPGHPMDIFAVLDHIGQSLT